jgi:hypothetical protein
MEGLHPDDPDASPEEMVDRIVAAGFDGLSVDCVVPDLVARVARAARANGLVVEGQAISRSGQELREALALAAAHDVRHLVVQPNLRLGSPVEAADVLAAWRLLAMEAGVLLLVETHRGRLTNDLPFTLALLDCDPAIQLLADLSHYVAGHSIEFPVEPDDGAMIQRVLERAGGFHGRVANSEHVQVELSFAAHRHWLGLFLDWWEEGFRSWQRRAPPEASLTFTCELGPPPYANVDANGRDTTDRWQEALLLAHFVRERWARGIGASEAAVQA